MPGEKLWRIPLVGRCRGGGTEALSRKSPTEILATQPPPVPETIQNVYELKFKRELICYYHAAASFPTKPTWLDAIRNGHYKTWPGLEAATAAKFFPESDEVWKGHGQKIKMDLRSTKQALEDEGDTRPTSIGEQALYENV